MKKECQRTKRLLPDYLRGHVFSSTRKRIDKHIAKCVVCKSELDTLKHVADTRQLLNYLHEPEGISHRFRNGFAALAGLKKLVYRPVLVATVAAIAVGIYYYSLAPRQIDIDIDTIMKTSPTTTAQAIPVQANEPVPVREEPKATVKAAGADRQMSSPTPTADRGLEPVMIAITPSSEASVRQINDVLRGHSTLFKSQFSDTEREISGSLTVAELMTLFNRIGPVAKVTYNRKRFSSHPVAQQIPFVLTLNAVQKTASPPAPVTKPVSTLETASEQGKAISSEPAVTAPSSPEARQP